MEPCPRLEELLACGNRLFGDFPVPEQGFMGNADDCAAVMPTCDEKTFFSKLIYDRRFFRCSGDAVQWDWRRTTRPVLSSPIATSWFKTLGSTSRERRGRDS